MTFGNPHAHGSTLTHRVVRVVPQRDGTPRGDTRGDANRAAEHWTISPVGTVGLMHSTVGLPKVAGLLLDRSHQRGYVMLVLSVLSGVMTLVSIWRRPPRAVRRRRPSPRARALTLLLARRRRRSRVAAPWTDGPHGAASTFAAAAEFPPVVRQLPVVLGAPQAALPLRATGGTFAPATTSATYTWLRCNAAGGGVRGDRRRGDDRGLHGGGRRRRLDDPGRHDAGQRLGRGAVVRSEPSQVVLAQGAGPSIWAPVATNTPAISGTATVGATLTGTTGTWVQLLGVTQWQWQRCDATGAGCAAIAGATSQTYAPTAADRGRRLSLTVTVNVLNLARTTADTDTTAIVT